MIREPLIFELSDDGKKSYALPELDVPVNQEVLKNLNERKDIEGFPQVSEIEVVRHFTRLSQINYCIDTGFYPLGSCTMKYNPKINEKIAAMPGFQEGHPYSPASLVQGNLAVIKSLEELLMEITGMDAFSLQPSAGAQGELLGMMLIRACLEERGDPRKYVLIPDSAHGTNPSSAHICGYQVKEIKTTEEGIVDVEDLKRLMNQEIAAIMITNPNTLGIFERDIKKIAHIVHSEGGFVYMDGANMNALLGYSRPGDMDVDVIHLNLHKTFSTPHGGGGPGSGPVGVKQELKPFLPVPVVEKDKDGYYFNYDRPKSIGRVKGFYGNYLVMVKALAYILSLGARGLKEVAEIAVLNSNYIRKSLEGTYHLKYQAPTLHECVFSDKNQLPTGIKNIDIAKRLIDYGLHPPTMSFPLIVPGALMIEPTETESKRDLDHFIDAMIKISEEAEKDPEILKSAPTSAYVSRLDETAAARNTILRWEPDK
ncbi:MAG: aminomethyl-transferring glycine dehydrogenase subunit GcvPB [Candidatus Aminicenantes bacterium]|nr:aminomethyl-transferring glycine dehydrogenase subunit GcvPB [Candidatus Aminicenantes bacterium]